MMYVLRILFICKEKRVIYHLDYTSYCELNPFCIVRLKKERKKERKKEKDVVFSLSVFLVFVVCSSVVCKPHFPVSARYSNQRANKDYLTVHVYSLEEKTE